MSNPTIEIRRTEAGEKLTRVYFGNVVVWFSYETPVAFHVPGQKRVVSENVWNTTTGKHINAIPGSTPRTEHTEFVRLFDAMQAKVAAALDAAFAEPAPLDCI